MFICLLNMNSPVFPSLDDIYCIEKTVRKPHKEEGKMQKAGEEGRMEGRERGRMENVGEEGK